MNLPEKYAVECKNAEETNEVLKHINSNLIKFNFNYWKYVTFDSKFPVSEINPFIYDDSEEEKFLSYTIVQFKEWKDIINYNDNWCIKQNLHQDICNWFNEKYQMDSMLDGSYKYLVNRNILTNSESRYTNKIPNGYREIGLKEFYKITNMKKELTIPEKWYLQINKETLPYINTIRKNNHFNKTLLLLEDFNYVIVSNFNNHLEIIGSNTFFSNYEEISLEQFKNIFNMKTIKKNTLTREQLIKLYHSDECTEWKKEIEEILKVNLFENDNEFIIHDSVLQLLNARGSANQKELVRNLGISIPKSVEEIYFEEQLKCDLKVGDEVKVVRKAEDYENGWDCAWGDPMNDTVGKSFKIKKNR